MPKEKTKIVYITGLGHSGTTLLNLMLGGNSQVYGTGEGFYFFKQREEFLKSELVCTCNSSYHDCVFWADVEKEIRDNRVSSQEQYIQTLINSCNRLPEGRKIVIDSSKSLKLLDQISKLEDVEVKVILLIKDVRSWSFSTRKKARSYDYYRFRQHNYLRLFRTWFLENKKIEEHLKNNKYQYVKTTYEGICFAPQETLENLCEFIGIGYEERMLKPDRTEQHFINGNRMRLSKTDNIEVKYDDAWLYDPKWFFASLLMPHIMRFNQEIHNRTP